MRDISRLNQFIGHLSPQNFSVCNVWEQLKIIGVCWMYQLNRIQWLQLNVLEDRVVSMESAKFLYTGKDKAFADKMAAGIVEQPDLSVLASDPNVMSSLLVRATACFNLSFFGPSLRTDYFFE